MQQALNESIKYEYLIRVNRAIDYVHAHYTEEINLAGIAKIACFSPSHFHRLFRLVTGETVNDFVRRTRMAKAAYVIATNPTRSITDIALENGFSSSQNFARDFKAFFGISPSFSRENRNWEKWKTLMIKGHSMDRRQVPEVAAVVYDYYVSRVQQSIKNILEKNEPMAVTVTKLPSYRVAYVRGRGPYTTENLAPIWKRLAQWAEPRGLDTEHHLYIGAYWSNPETTTEDKFISDACVTLPEDMIIGNEINVQALPGGLYAIHHCEIAANEIDDVTMAMLLNWMAVSPYQPDNRPGYHIHYNDYETHPLKHMILDICLPVKPIQGR